MSCPKRMIQNTTLMLAVNLSDDAFLVVRQGFVEPSEEFWRGVSVMSPEFNVFPRRLP